MRYKTGWYRWVGAPQNQLPGTGRAVGTPCWIHCMILHCMELRGMKRLNQPYGPLVKHVPWQGQHQRKGLFCLIFPKAPSACQALHLHLPRGMLFSDLHKGSLQATSSSVPMGVYGRWIVKKEENKGWLGPGQDRETGTDSNSLIYTFHPLCDIPCPAPRSPGPYSFFFVINVNLLSDFSFVLHRKWLIAS